MQICQRILTETGLDCVAQETHSPHFRQEVGLHQMQLCNNTQDVEVNAKR